MNALIENYKLERYWIFTKAYYDKVVKILRKLLPLKIHYYPNRELIEEYIIVKILGFVEDEIYINMSLDSELLTLSIQAMNDMVTVKLEFKYDQNFDRVIETLQQIVTNLRKILKTLYPDQYTRRKR
ncbi:MAG: hypothetical protein QW669_03770 [Desulfurococcaceae archaeon]